MTCFIVCSWLYIGTICSQYWNSPLAIFQEMSLSPCNLSPPPLPFSNTAKYEDEEMYMGDNEADKLKEDRWTMHKRETPNGKENAKEGH